MQSVEQSLLTYDCSAAQSVIPAEECLALVELYNSTNGDQWKDRRGWGAEPPDQWFGIGVQAGHVRSIHLGANRLTGSVPASLADLPELRELLIGSNKLTGTIPEELGTLSLLGLLDLADNTMSGPIPSSFGGLSRLRHLYLNTNAFEGNLPAALGSLPELARIVVFDNRCLGGMVPDSFADLQLSSFNSEGMRCLYPETSRVAAFMSSIAPDWQQGCRDQDADNLLDDLEDLNPDEDCHPDTMPLNTDGDSVPDYLDSDDDNDGVPTSHEHPEMASAYTRAGIKDLDGDGIPSGVDADETAAPEAGDSDHDGINDAVECGGSWPCKDTDQDGTPDYMTNQCAGRNGQPCDDGFFCNGQETCHGSLCTGSTGNPCVGVDGDDNCAESCSERDDSCTAADPNGSPCDDTTFCNGVETCADGLCKSSGSPPCSGPDGDDDCRESCDESAHACTANDPNGLSCAGGGVCLEGICGAPAGGQCDTDNTCATRHCSDGVCCFVASCAPFRCGDDGACPLKCTSSAQCSEGTSCSSQGQCEEASHSPSDPSGCGCRLVTPSQPRGSWILGGLVGLLFTRRKRTALSVTPSETPSAFSLQ